MNPNSIIGFTCGAFDLLHPGHLHLLSAAKEQCDYLYVGLHTDPSVERREKNKPIQTSFERYTQLLNLKVVDHIFPYDTEADIYNFLATVDVNKRFIGSEYKNETFTAKDLCEELGIEIVYVTRKHNWSSSSFRERFKNAKSNH